MSYKFVLYVVSKIIASPVVAGTDLQLTIGRKTKEGQRDTLDFGGARTPFLSLNLASPELVLDGGDFVEFTGMGSYREARTHVTVPRTHAPTAPRSLRAL
jgi:hypothetical protein